jgi:hypothetical protein
VDATDPPPLEPPVRLRGDNAALVTAVPQAPKKLKVFREPALRAESLFSFRVTSSGGLSSSKLYFAKDAALLGAVPLFP